MSAITVKFAGMGGSQEVTVNVDEGTTPTVADARQAAGLSPELSIRSGGERLADDAAISDEQLLVTAPPEAKQGR